MDAYELLVAAPGWPPNTNIYSLTEPLEGNAQIAVTAMPDTTTYGPGQAMAVPCDAEGALVGDSMQAVWWAAGTFTHAEVLDALGYTITDPPPEEPTE